MSEVLDTDLVRPPLGSVMVACQMFELKEAYYQRPECVEWSTAMRWDRWHEEVGPWSWLGAPALVST